MRLVMASANPHKVEEISNILVGCRIDERPKGLADIEENAETLEGNAHLKATAVCNFSGDAAVADDTGLEVDALNDAPGVYSARYAGAQKNAEDNMNLLLLNLSNKINRKARFRTCISLCLDGVFYEFEGICEGEITLQKLAV